MKKRIEEKRFKRWLRGAHQFDKYLKDIGPARRYLARERYLKQLRGVNEVLEHLLIVIDNYTASDAPFIAKLIGTKQESP